MTVPARFSERMCLAVLLLGLSVPVFGESAVWQIEKAGKRLFLGGTLHLLTPEDYPLPDSFENAYRRSQLLVFETDIQRLKQPETQRQLTEQLSFPQGESLKSVVSAQTYQSLAEFFTARGVAMAQIDRYKPGMVSILMSVIELQRIRVVAVGVDDYFNDRAIEDGVPRAHLETVEQQIAFLAAMGQGQEDAMLRYSLADLEQMPKLWRALKLAWRDGDLAALDSIGGLPLREQFPDVYRDLLITRNQAWLPQIEAMAGTAEIELILVGALHLAGPDGLLQMLENRGYQIRQMP